MAPPSNKPSQFQKTVLLWAILWMLSLPFFHVHPEADHRHGEPGHQHGGIAHTVFSQDLGCEYAAHVHDQVPEDSGHRYLHSTQPQHAFNHPEIEFALLSEPTDHSVDKPTLAGSALADIPVALPPPCPTRVFNSSLVLPAAQCVVAGTSPRAPPLLSI